MATHNFTYPNDETLTTVLSSALKSSGVTDKRIRIRNRRKDEIGWNHSEVVSCQTENGSNIGVFCKYSSEHDPSRHKFGHRGGVRYEAAVYRHLLPRANMSLPRLFGVYEDAENDRIWLFVKYLKDGKRVSRTRNYRESMINAANWIGRFHAVNEKTPIAGSVPFLKYDAAYYKGWAQRTLSFSTELNGGVAWLEKVCKGFEDLIEDLRTASSTLLHGEYYPANILIDQGTIYPIDWESAAFGPGEIDLATLTDCWPADIAQACKHAYKNARWRSAAPPHDFECTLGAARIYVHLRWLGDRPEWTTHTKNAHRFVALREAAASMGLI